jgi:hypothetical protein
MIVINQYQSIIRKNTSAVSSLKLQAPYYTREIFEQTLDSNSSDQHGCSKLYDADKKLHEFNQLIEWYFLIDCPEWLNYFNNDLSDASDSMREYIGTEASNCENLQQKIKLFQKLHAQFLKFREEFAEMASMPFIENRQNQFNKKAVCIAELTEAFIIICEENILPPQGWRERYHHTRKNNH